MLPFSENNQNINIFRRPPEHFAIGYVHNYNLPQGNIAFQYVISKQLQEGLMVFSNDSLALSEDQDKICRIYQNYLLAFKLLI